MSRTDTSWLPSTMALTACRGVFTPSCSAIVLSLSAPIATTSCAYTVFTELRVASMRLTFGP